MNRTGPRPGFISLSLLAAALYGTSERARTNRAAAAYCMAALVIALLSSVLMIDTDLVAAGVGIRWPYDRDPTARLVGWRSMAGSRRIDFAVEERNTISARRFF